MGSQSDKCLNVECGRSPIQRKLSMHQFANTQQIVSALEVYTKKHRIIFYPTYERELIQHLFSLRQKHICDILVKLTEKRQQEQKKLLINDLMRIDLQKMDKMFFALVHSRNLKEINTDLPNIKKHAVDKKQIKCETTSNLSQQQRAKFTLMGEKVIKDKNIIVMACVECFNGINCLTEGVLPSGKCCLELILDKVIALNDRYFDQDKKNLMPIQIILLINALYLQQTTQLCSQKYPNLRWHAIKYESVMPSFDSEGRIVLKKSIIKNKFNSKNGYKSISQELNKPINYRLDFSTEKGDLLSFIDQNYHIAELLQHYEYIHWVDPCNVMENVCDPLAIGMMLSDQSKALSKIVRTVPFAKQHTNIIIKQNFIRYDIPEQIEQKNSPSSSTVISSSSNLKIKHLIESVILSTKLLVNRQPTINKNLLTRIHKIKISSYEDQLFSKQQSETERETIKDNGIYVFQRSIIDILHCRYTKVILVNEKNQFSPYIYKLNYDMIGMLAPQIVYSNYCKKFLKIPQQKDSQLVQVCPEILYGSVKKQKAIINSVSNLKKIGFPLIIVRNMDQIQEKE